MQEDFLLPYFSAVMTSEKSLDAVPMQEDLLLPYYYVAAHAAKPHQVPMQEDLLLPYYCQITTR